MVHPWLSMRFWCVGVLILSHLAGAFFPSEFRENLIGRLGYSHAYQSRKAFINMSKEFFGITKLSKSMEHAEVTINIVNQRVDLDQVAHKHFDGETFAEGQQRLVDLANEVRQHLKEKQPYEARVALGQALHTLQDFYAHTNHVEIGLSKGNLSIYPGLGQRDVIIGGSQQASFINVPTCGDCADGTGLLDPLLCLDCTNNVVLSFLTSGYYASEKERQPPAGVRKCNHGSPLDGSVNHDPPSAQSGRKNGLSKDSSSCIWSPHWMYHRQAASTAQLATEQFYRDLNLPKDHLKLLFGVGPSLGFAVDTTGSMGTIIADVRTQLIKIVDSRTSKDLGLTQPDIPNLYVLAPFGESSIGYATAMTDPEEFKNTLRGLGASGGGDCPERSMTGVLAALKALDAGADLFLVTDASAKDANLKSEVIKLAQDKQIKIHTLVFPSECSQDDSYAEISIHTGGNWLTSAAGTAGDMILLADKYAKPHSTSIYEVIEIDLFLDNYQAIADVPKINIPKRGTKSYSIPVDGSMGEILFSAGGNYTLDVVRPDGSIVKAGDEGVDLRLLANRTFLAVEKPLSGTWTASMSGAGNMSLSVTGQSTLQFADFSLVENAGRDGHDGYLPIVDPIPYDTRINCTARIEGEYQSISFEVRDFDGTLVEDVVMEAGDGTEGGAATNAFFGEITIKTGSNRIYARGIDASGAPFLRYLPIPAGNASLEVLVPSSSRTNTTTTANFTTTSVTASTLNTTTTDMTVTTPVYLNSTTRTNDATSTQVITSSTAGTTSTRATDTVSSAGWDNWPTDPNNPVNPVGANPGAPPYTKSLPGLLGSPNSYGMEKWDDWTSANKDDSRIPLTGPGISSVKLPTEPTGIEIPKFSGSPEDDPSNSQSSAVRPVKPAIEPTGFDVLDLLKDSDGSPAEAQTGAMPWTVKPSNEATETGAPNRPDASEGYPPGYSADYEEDISAGPPTDPSLNANQPPSKPAGYYVPDSPDDLSNYPTIPQTYSAVDFSASPPTADNIDVAPTTVAGPASPYVSIATMNPTAAGNTDEAAVISAVQTAASSDETGGGSLIKTFTGTASETLSIRINVSFWLAVTVIDVVSFGILSTVLN